MERHARLSVFVFQRLSEQLGAAGSQDRSPVFHSRSESLSKHKFQIANLTEVHYRALALMIQHSAGGGDGSFSLQR